MPQTQSLRIFQWTQLFWLSVISGIAFGLIPVAIAEEANPYAVPTYECIGIYYRHDDPGGCAVRFREAGADAWRAALGLVYDPRDREYRGSLVNLKPDTGYEIELTCGGETVTLPSKTRSDQYPIGRITTLADGVSREPLVITQSGTPDAYHLIQPAAGAKATLDMMNAEDASVVIDADYVIVRGIESRNAARHGILIKAGRHDVVIEDCRITFWGRIGGPVSYGNEGNMDSAIYAERGAGRLTLQRNLIEDPRGASNDWETGHPSGPQGISLINSCGGNVIRYNEIRSTEDHGYNDGIGGGSNFSFEGSPNRDSDIYGNIISHVWDDAIESEGANQNVRIWGNYLFLTYQHIATACTSKGPLYIFCNVFGKSRWTHQNPLGGSLIKVGERDEFGGGRRFVFHNTALQPKGAFHVFSGHINPNTVTRNNIFDCPGRLTSSTPADPPGDYDYDLFTGMDRGAAQEKHGVRGKPAYIHSYGLEWYPAASTTKIQWGRVPFQKGGRTIEITDPVVTVPNPVIDAGEVIPGFNDDYMGKAPDLGAFELGGPPLKFGRRAQGDFWAPWELK
ncbi:MAG TPA: right-handed parallel beta-helix repeat-containing protein [bacterium]|nr:right-handed parallel beta-helix repeat-containing protein [bacterium]